MTEAKADLSGRSLKKVILCNCRGERIAPDLLNAIEAHLKRRPVSFYHVTDLCGVAAISREKVSSLFINGTDYLVLGCYRRTLDLLLNQCGRNAGSHTVYKHINLIGISNDEAVNQIDEFCGKEEGTPDITYISEDSGWSSWYPVIDYARCSSCGQCADFCLFGVYEKTGNRVMVVNPQGCKDNCPACARICPSAAIIFPKYKYGGAIGGSDEIDEISEHLRQIQDIDNILGGDIYEALRKRKEMRKSIIREDVLRRAFVERDQAKAPEKQN